MQDQVSGFTTHHVYGCIAASYTLNVVLVKEFTHTFTILVRNSNVYSREMTCNYHVCKDIQDGVLGKCLAKEFIGQITGGQQVCPCVS